MLDRICREIAVRLGVPALEPFIRAHVRGDPMPDLGKRAPDLSRYTMDELDDMASFIDRQLYDNIPVWSGRRRFSACVLYGLRHEPEPVKTDLE